jgi:beta-N-acetylhexosaminidase
MEPAILKRRAACRARAARAGRALAAALALAAVLWPALPAAASPGAPGFWEAAPGDPVALADGLSDEELLGQSFMLGWLGQDASPELLAWIRRGLGGVKIFTRNVDTLEGLRGAIRAMQKEAGRTRLGVPLFVSTDQEGGWVRHVKAGTSDTPGNIALGASGLPRDALLTGYYIGRELAALGINMNFAPTIDVYSNPSAAVIGPRAFSADPRATALLALAWFRGLAASGVISTAKHYPGHGHADRDSHGALPVVPISFQELWERELLPYRVLIPEGLPAIMTGHLAFPRILGDLTPSSRSPYLVGELLRGRLGFDGLVITDDMEMTGALGPGVDTPQACLEALRAGSDVVLVSHTPELQERTWSFLLSRLASDPAFKARLRESARRVLRLKSRLYRDQGFPLEPSTAAVPAPGAREFFAESALRSTTVVKGEGLPYAPKPGERLLLAGQLEEFLTQGRRRFPRAETLSFSYLPFYQALGPDKARLRQAAGAYDTIIFCLANYNSLEVLKELAGLAPRLIVVSTLSPVLLAEVPWVRTAVAVYGTGPVSFAGGFAVLAGDFPAEGRLPVDLKP